MNRLLSSLLVLSIGAGALATRVAHAADAETCDVGTPRCEPDTYLATWRFIQAGQCPNGGIKSECLRPPVAPSPALLQCSQEPGGILCEAWPQANGQLHYAWSFNGVTLDYAPNTTSPIIYANCGDSRRGRVTVTVISPGFASATASVYGLCTDPTL
jgi:hypothetical protein